MYVIVLMALWLPIEMILAIVDADDNENAETVTISMCIKQKVWQSTVSGLKYILVFAMLSPAPSNLIC